MHARDAGDLRVLADAFDALGPEHATVDHDLRRVAVPVDAGTDRLRDAVRIVDDLGIAIDDIGLRRPTLDEVFLTLTGNAADGEPEPAAA